MFGLENEIWVNKCPLFYLVNDETKDTKIAKILKLSLIVNAKI